MHIIYGAYIDIIILKGFFYLYFLQVFLNQETMLNFQRPFVHLYFFII